MACIITESGMPLCPSLATGEPSDEEGTTSGGGAASAASAEDEGIDKLVALAEEDDNPVLTDLVKQELARMQAAVRASEGYISANASPVDIATEDSNPGQIFVRNGDEVGDAAQNVAYSVAPHQYQIVAHAGDLITDIGVLIVLAAEAIAKALGNG